MRRFSSALTRSADRGRPAGIPSRTATRPRPCDSPAVVKRNIRRAPVACSPCPPLCNLVLTPCHPLPVGRGGTHLGTRTDNNTRARLRVGLSDLSQPSLSTPWRGGQGVRTHRGDGIRR